MRERTDHSELVRVFDERMRRGLLPDAGTGIDVLPGIVRQVGTADSWNGILWSDLDAARADEVIAEQVRFFTDAGVDFEWKLYSHDRPADLGDRLVAAGFTAGDPEAVMIAKIEDLPTTVPPPAGVELVRVTDAAGVQLMTAVHNQAFGASSERLGRRILAQLTEAPDGVVAVVAMADGEPVSAARMDLHEGTGFASLWGGGTVAKWRHRGIYRALVGYRADLAAERGYEYLQVDASDQSRPILTRLGFAHVSTTTPLEYLAGPAS